LLLILCEILARFQFCFYIPKAKAAGGLAEISRPLLQQLTMSKIQRLTPVFSAPIFR